jgi:hypothetical protein
MGIAALEQFSSMAHFVPSYYPQDHQLTNKLFLIMHDPTGATDAHMSLLVDIAGTSTDTHVKGVLCHVVANTKDGQIPHSTNPKCDYWEELKSKLSLIYIGNIVDSKYLSGVHPLPSYISPPWVIKPSFSFPSTIFFQVQNDIHRHLVDPHVGLFYKQSALHLLVRFIICIFFLCYLFDF